MAESAPKSRDDEPHSLAAGQAKQVVAELGRRRVAALAGPSPTSPGKAGALAGSAADHADSVAVQSLWAMGAHYQGLRIDVREAAPRHVWGQRAEVDVVLDASEYSVVGRDGAVLRRVPAQRGVRRRLGLVWTAQGWLVATVRVG